MLTMEFLMATLHDALAQAWQQHRAGNHAGAESLAQQVLASASAEATGLQADALSLLASIGRNRGQLAEALQYLERAAELRPNDVNLHNELGMTLARQGRLIEAQERFRRVLHLVPQSPVALNNLGIVLKDAGRLDEAVDCFRQALRLGPAWPELLGNLSNALRRQGNYDEALFTIQQAIRLRPDSPQMHNTLGRVLADQKKLDEAAACFHRAVSLRPSYAEALSNLALVFEAQGKRSEALDWVQQAVRLQPGSAEAHHSLGVVLTNRERFPEAEASFREAIRLKPDLYEAHLSLGLLFEEQQQWDQATDCFAQAIRLRPDQPDAHVELAHLLLRGGDFERGWVEYEWRWHSRELRSRRRDFRQPRWDGSPLHGRTILLHAEQGLGDVVQFLRLAPLVKQHGGTVLFECPPALLDLCRGAAGIDQLIPFGSAGPEFDVQAPLLSLPRILGTTVATIPAQVPYLQRDPARVEHWRRELASLPGYKVGIAWQGNPEHLWDYKRSVPLETLAPLAAVPGVHLVSLQKGHGAEQLQDVLGRWPVTDLARDLTDTAAIMSNLDLVVCVDTVMAHLAGALAVPVWLALSFIADWRWLLDRDDSPWYPTMRLFRQSRRGDWAEVFQRLAAGLSRAIADNCSATSIQPQAGDRVRPVGSGDHDR
jgi:tetratricopeptide (TPR) repeat protein